MNTIKELFTSIPNEELVDAIQEIKISDTTGFIGDIVRKYSRLTSEITGESTSSVLFMTQINILKEAAFRWCPTNIE